MDLYQTGICGVKTRNSMNNQKIDWTNITHFKPEEFTCGCGCGYNPIDIQLVNVLENIRAHFGNRLLYVTSGCRCSTFNKKVGGIERQQTRSRTCGRFLYKRNFNGNTSCLLSVAC